MAANVMEIYGSKVFNEHVMKERLPSATYKSLERTLHKGAPLDIEVANVVASVMKRWAMELGAPSGRRRSGCIFPPSFPPWRSPFSAGSICAWRRSFFCSSSSFSRAR